MRSQQWSGIFKNINVIVLKKRSTGIKQNSGCIFGKYNESLAFSNKISTVKYWQTVRILYLFGTMGMMRHVSCVCGWGGGGGWVWEKVIILGRWYCGKNLAIVIYYMHFYLFFTPLTKDRHIISCCHFDQGKGSLSEVKLTMVSFNVRTIKSKMLIFLRVGCVLWQTSVYNNSI